MKLGTAKLVITPQEPLRLSGYATRTTPFTEVREDIFVRTHIHIQGEKRIVFVYADILWWGSDFVKTLKEEIFRRLGIPPHELLFVASHNHSGPPTSDLFTQSLEVYNKNYAEFLSGQVIKSIELAMNNLEDIDVYRHDGTAGLNVFRRRLVNGKIEMLPNYKVPADHKLTVISYIRKNGSLKGSMIHYPCHANLSNENFIQPDYPGIALRMLDESYPDSNSIFLQGCTGDLRPNSVLGEEFTPQNYEKTAIFAKAFFNKCKTLLETKGNKISPQLDIISSSAKLPLENLLSKEAVAAKLESDVLVDREWAQKVLEKDNRNYEKLEISYLRYGDIFSLYTLNCEISQYYAEYARKIDKNAICAGYTNGMIGYISTADQIAEGGYEPEGSALYFALAGNYSPEVENIIHSEMQNIKNRMEEL